VVRTSPSCSSPQHNKQRTLAHGLHDPVERPNVGEHFGAEGQLADAVGHVEREAVLGVWMRVVLCRGVLV
jgi:hypothetical protein